MTYYKLRKRGITIYDSLVVTILDNCDSILRQYYKNSRN